MLSTMCGLFEKVILNRIKLKLQVPKVFLAFNFFLELDFQ